MITRSMASCSTGLMRRQASSRFVAAARRRGAEAPASRSSSSSSSSSRNVSAKAAAGAAATLRPALAAAAEKNPALARQTEVVDFRSPPGVIARKREELAEVGPSGPLSLVAYGAVAPFVWAAAALAAAPALLKSAAGQAGAPPAERAAPPFQMHEEFVAVDGGRVRLHCVSPRPRDRSKPLMLMLHGFPELWYSWRWQMEEFADDYDVVAIDQRGYSDSDKPSGVAPYRLERLAADVADAVKALGHDRVGVLVAHDWGGNVAWTVAGTHGSRLIDRLVVIALPHFGVGVTNIDGAQRAKSSYVLQFQAPGLPEATLTAGGAEAAEKFFTEPPVGVVNRGAMTPGDVAWFRRNLSQSATPMLNWYRALFRTLTLGSNDGDADVWRALRTPIDVPTLVLHGDEDIALGTKLLDGIEAAFAEESLVDVKLMRRCSHWIQQDYPLQVNSLLRGWLDARR